MNTKEQLLAKREQYENQRQQISHQLQRLEQREKYLRQGAAKERTHMLLPIIEGAYKSIPHAFNR